MIPAPMPEWPDRYTASSTPAATPRTCSARMPRSASLPTATGRPRLSARAAPSGASCQPRFGACRTCPSLRRTIPGTATPTRTTLRSVDASSSVAILAMAATTVACSAGPPPVGAVTTAEDRAAEADPRDAEVGHADVHGQHLHPLGLRHDDVRRAAAGAGRLAAVPVRSAGLLPQQAGRDQLAGEVADGAAVEAELRRSAGCAPSARARGRTGAASTGCRAGRPPTAPHAHPVPGPSSAALTPPGRCRAAPGHGVDTGGQQQHATGHHVDDSGRLVEQAHAVRHDRHHQAADDRRPSACPCRRRGWCRR